MRKMDYVCGRRVDKTLPGTANGTRLGGLDR